ncbi:hypothetical protein EON83_06905 [bacterium]|nr:MAG: hypothetical protein EON83_06905 [bacterium]
MIGFFRVLGRVFGWLLRTRALRPVLAFAIFVWAFDGLVATATDFAWFSSVGMEALWREQLMWKLGVGTAFVVLALLASIPLMRAVARPVAKAIDEPTLPRALMRWQSQRARAPRLGWLCIFAVSLVLGRGLSHQWSKFALASSSPAVKENLADFWMVRAPAMQSGLAALWDFALALCIIVLATGVLRALPFLAARPSITPVRWLRALWGIGVALCLLRALGFGIEAMRHAQIANDSNAARVGFILLNALGVLGCVAIIALLPRPRPTLALMVLAVLILPGLGGDLLAPFVGRSSLTPPTPTTLATIDGVPNDWPQWDEATLIRALSNQVERDAQHHLLTWQRAGINSSGNSAQVVGTPIQADQWAGHGMSDREGEISWQSLELPEQRTALVPPPVGQLFYGLSARPLLEDDANNIGVPFQSWLWKLAWAWTLRDPLLLIEGAQSQRLIVMRGTREVGQKLAPFWTWDDVVPRRDPKTGDAYFECVAYSSSARLPRSAAFESGVFAGQNSVIPIAVLRVDVRSGAISLAPFAATDPLSRGKHWSEALPSLFSSKAARLAPTPALEVSLSSGTPLVWLRTESGWQKKAIPVDLRDELVEKRAEFEQLMLTKSAVRLEGATPMMWRQGDELFVSQAFFDLTITERERTDEIPKPLPLVEGVAVGPLREHTVRWSTTFTGARVALSAPDVPAGSSPPFTAPLPAGTRPLRDVAQEALDAEDAANSKLRAGLYVDSQKQRTRLRELLEELKRRAR